MDELRAQDMLRHILKDEDKGKAAFDKLNLSDSFQVLTKLLPSCLDKAMDINNKNDIAFFEMMQESFEEELIDKIKNAKNLWIVYSEVTGYPYMVDSDIICFYEFKDNEKILDRIRETGYSVVLGGENQNSFKEEIAHMYRNGAKNIRFVGDVSEHYTIAREKFYEYDELMSEDFVSNPALQSTMINFFQEFKRDVEADIKDKLLATREDKMINAFVNADYLVPYTSSQNGDVTEIEHPFVDLTNLTSEFPKDEFVAGLPVFTDGIELEKCYPDSKENMLYSFDELISSIEDVGAHGIVVNPVGISYFVSLDMLKKFRAKGETKAKEDTED